MQVQDLSAKDQIDQMTPALDRPRTSSADLGEILKRGLDMVVQIQHADAGMIQRYDRTAGTLTLVAHRGMPVVPPKSMSTAQSGDGLPSLRALATRSTVIIEDLASARVSDHPERQIAPAGFRSAVSMPLISRDGSVIAIVSTYFHRRHRPSERALQLTDLSIGFMVDLIETLQNEKTAEAIRRDVNRASQEKSRLVAAAVHELRQSLQTISLRHGVLGQKVATLDARTTLFALEDTVAEMAGRIESLLNMTCLSDRLVEQEATDIPVGQLLQRIADRAVPLVNARRMDLRVVGSSAVVRSDIGLFDRMISELIATTLKYTQGAKMLLGVRRAQGSIRIEIWDIAPGLPAHDIAALFDDHDLANERADAKVRLCLGLWIVKQLADRLGHQIKVHSTASGASALSICVESPHVVAVGPDPPLAHGYNDHAVPVILLVNDDRYQLETLRCLLEMQSYRVIAVRSLAEAIAWIDAATTIQPSVVITQYRHHEWDDPLELVQHIRRKMDERIPAIIVGDLPIDRRMTERDSDGSLFIKEPYRAADILAAVATLVGLRHPSWAPPSFSLPASLAPPAAAETVGDVAVVDSEPGVGDALQEMLLTCGVKAQVFRSAEAFLADVDHHRFRCVISDLSLPAMSGLELLSRLKADGARAAVIFLSGRGDLPVAVQAMREGADDFLTKPVAPAALQESVARVMSGAVTDTDDQPDLADIAYRLTTLTAREREVMDRVILGRMNKSIAAELGISVRTAEHHRQSIMRKLGVKSLAMLVRMVA